MAGGEPVEPPFGEYGRDHEVGRVRGPALMRTFMRLFAQTPADAALETLYAAFADVVGETRARRRRAAGTDR